MLRYEDTFNPVFKLDTIRTVLSIDVSRDCQIHQLDIKNVFLHEDLTDKVYMKQPHVYIDSHFCDYVCWLYKSIYVVNRHPHA